MATRVTSLVTEGLLYRGGEGQYAWWAHRIAGLGTLLFLAIHILDTATVYFAPQLYGHAIAIYRTWIFGLGEVALVACVIYHGLNGLRVAILDLRPDWMPHHKQLENAVIAGFIVLFTPAALIMLNNVLQHAILGGG